MASLDARDFFMPQQRSRLDTEEVQQPSGLDHISRGRAFKDVPVVGIHNEILLIRVCE